MIVSPSTAMRASRGSASRSSRTSRCGSIGTASDAIARASCASFSSRFARELRRASAPSALAQPAARERRDERLGGRARVGDDAELELGAAPQLLGRDVDLRDARGRRAAARGCRSRRSS